MSRRDPARVDAGVERIDNRSFAVTLDGHDLIHVRMRDDGYALVTVFTTTDPDEGRVAAERVVAWDGHLQTVEEREHEERRLRGECPECAAQGTDDEEDGQ